MNDRAEGTFEALNMLSRTLRGSFFAAGLGIVGVISIWEGLILILGVIFGALIFAAGFSGFPDMIIGYVARRRGELYMRVFALLTPLLSTVGSLAISLFLWLGIRAGIPLLWNPNFMILLFVLAALVNLGVFLSNTLDLIRGRTNT